jgi:hypothetical protein
MDLKELLYNLEKEYSNDMEFGNKVRRRTIARTIRYV